MSRKPVSGDMGRHFDDPPERVARRQEKLDWIRSLIPPPKPHRSMVLWTHESHGIAQFKVWCRTCHDIGWGTDKPWLEQIARDHEENN